ncbi:group II intron maturase-specific domain-containing protein [Wolbachia endosymbiont (group B) of Sphaerophoria taeniata]|uniref:group II intron maturase-specific domain-containing protein n=1 Tax=Wolbachia endosymbiont (group B) of Sphaerophoria taeniata TaxID=2954058 RepID=UPI002220DDAA|nr:group II intron maturase-specific domain-containing protein [Wolbachia endosymbiont (group B) of Sphaerophoria taeniata]
MANISIRYQIAQKVRSWRLKRKYALKDLAGKANINYHTLLRYEQGTCGIPIERLKVIADALSVPIRNLFPRRKVLREDSCFDKAKTQEMYNFIEKTGGHKAIYALTKSIRAEEESNIKAARIRIAHTLKSLNGEKPGFDFLGFSIRHYQTRQNKRGYKLLIKPSRKSISQHLLSIKHKLKELRAAPQETVIKELNPIIRGWSQYYISVVSSKVFNLLDYSMHNKLWKWAVYRHHDKRRCWVKRKYFKKYGNDNWRYMVNNKLYLIRHRDHAIKRHIKVNGNRSPYDGDWPYWGNRLSKLPDHE